MMIKTSIITSLYRPESYLEPFLSCFATYFSDPEIELILIHNDPEEHELAAISRYNDTIPQLKHLRVKRESVYKSWNRGIQASEGQYMAIWNVDDIRTREGLDRQSALLDEQVQAGIVTGDYRKVFFYGNQQGVTVHDRLRYSPFYGAPRFRNGCFLTWRKEIHENVGYFDEQFFISGDREFWYRATKRVPAAKVDAFLGYYLRDAGQGLSNSERQTDRALQDRESALIATRHARCYIVPPGALKAAQHYRRREVREFGTYRNIDWLPDRTPFSNLLSYLLFFVPVIKQQLVRTRFFLLKHLRS